MRERFEAILSPGRVIDHPLERRLYSRDGSIAMGDAGLVVLPETTAEVVACVRLAGELGVPVVPRGSGTGLCGGAVPLDGAIVLSVARMTRILDVDPAVPCARVEPGVLNLDLSVAVAPPGAALRARPLQPAGLLDRRQRRDQRRRPPLPGVGRHRAARPGHGDRARRRRGAPPGGPAPDPPGYDLRGFVVGGEGTLGVVTEVTVRLMRTPPEVRTMLLDFPGARGRRGRGGSSAAGVIPAAMEMMDRRMTGPSRRSCTPTAGDAAAVLLVEVDGPAGEVAAHTAVVERWAPSTGARRVRVARDAAEAAAVLEGAQERVRRRRAGRPELLPPRLRGAAHPPGRGPRGRRIAESHDLVVMNVFHAGDGNLHPLIASTGATPSRWSGSTRPAGDHRGLRRGGRRALRRARHRAGEARLHAADVLDVDLDAQARAREAFDPEGAR